MGTGTVFLSPSGGGWLVTLVSLKVSSHTAEPTATLFLNTVNEAGFLEASYSGSGDSSDTTHVLLGGEILYCVWTGGDPGALASLRVSGWQYQDGERINPSAIH
jgi:hypothetical protein